jgi:hypothetical protein
MQLKEVCAILAAIEHEHDVNAIEVEGLLLWPLIRQCVWLELVSDAQSSAVQGAKEKTLQLTGGVSRVVRLIRALSVSLFNKQSTSLDEATTAFLSRTAYLQLLPGDHLSFDRIVDPLVFLSRNREKVTKYYMSPWPANVTLYFPASVLRPASLGISPHAIGKFRSKLDEIALNAGLNPDGFYRRVIQAWSQFCAWNKAGKLLFRQSPNLKRVFLTSWYFPDMMGIIAAAKELGVETIDVQHGKQGKYQGMYSWWTRIPEQGYQLMPDRFWCWGQPSCNHILASSPARKTHKPYVGGFPWLDFYREFISPVTAVNARHDRRVLVTLQPPAGGHVEPIPDFVIEYLCSGLGAGTYFTFRCHPNDRGRREYCQRRLKNVPSDRFVISDGKSNLYDDLLQATHHITAYSSCCYEAAAFGVPTLLFGRDALDIYSEEIDAQIFSWTEGRVEDIEKWLIAASLNIDESRKQKSSYIASSLMLARGALG